MSDDPTRGPARPSRFRIPQHCSPDRRRGRAATIRQRRGTYELTVWHPPSEAMWEGFGEWLRFPLPLKLAGLPPEESFSWRKWGQFIQNQTATKVNQALSGLLNPRAKMESYREYARLFESIRPPAFAAERWRSDLDFAEQRLNGCNPMTLTRCADLPDDALCRAADDTLSTLDPGWTVQRAYDQGRLFACDYSAVRMIEGVIPVQVAWSAPTALFFAGEDGVLRPLAIRLWPADHSGPNTPVNPHSGPANWALAKCHFQMADGAYHEAVSHLLDTHLVIELIAVCAHRHLHPDHPIIQLLAPHFRDNLAIDALARTSLLNKGGPIDKAIGVGARGALNLVGAIWENWDFGAMSLDRDLARRGLDDREVLPFCWYREDATALAGATRQLTQGLAHVWYPDDAAVAADWEVQGWAAEVASAQGAALRGFPAAFTTRAELARTLAEILFRASAQHAAVNNGQYDRYGWPLYSPTSLRVTQANMDLAVGRPISEIEFWRTMPGRAQSLGQLNMARVLSAPTYTSLIRTGDSPAFHPDIEPAAADAVQTYRQRLATVSDSLRRRNTALASAGEATYTYLDPYNVSRSIEI
jgi:hypothetical protein